MFPGQSEYHSYAELSVFFLVSVRAIKPCSNLKGIRAIPLVLAFRKVKWSFTVKLLSNISLSTQYLLVL